MNLFEEFPIKSIGAVNALQKALDFQAGIMELLKMSESVEELTPGVYMHTFTSPEMTLADVARLLNDLPQEE